MKSERKPRRSKLHVNKRDELIKCLCPKTDGFNGKFGEACQEATIEILKLLRKAKKNSNYNSKFSTRCADTIYRTLQAPTKKEFDGDLKTEFTVNTLNALLCWFFVKKHPDDDFYEEHTIESLKKFFSLIEKKTNRKVSELKKINDFFLDINLIKNQISDPFNLYDFEIDENWEFSIVKSELNSNSELDEQNNKNLKLDNSDTKKSKEENNAKLYTDNKLDFKNIEFKKQLKVKRKQDKIKLKSLEIQKALIAEEKKEKLKSNRKKIFIGSIFGTIILVAGLYINYIFQKRHEQEQKVLRNRNLIENAKEKSNTRAVLLSKVISEINSELKKDYTNARDGNLSEGLINKIIFLSEKFKPYLYLEKDSIIKKSLSPERAILFNSIIHLDLNSDTYDKIFKRANFTASDFSNLDLSNLNFAKYLNGIKGSYKKELQGLITPNKRINFTGSSFGKANLENTILYGTFSQCNFKGAILNKTTFIWSDIENSFFHNTKMIDIHFENSNLKKSDFTASKIISNSGFVNCDLRGVKFDNSEFTGDTHPFVFENCFMSSRGTFFNYKFDSSNQAISITGNPYIEESPLFSEDVYYIYRNIDYKNRKKTIKKSDLDSAFTFFGNKTQEKQFFLSFKDSLDSDKMNHYIIRTNDNFERGGKYIRSLIRFNEKVWDVSELKLDTFYRRSSLNKLQIEYRGYIYDYLKNKTSQGIASFKNCTFFNTHFKNSSLEYVSFKNSNFINHNYFIRNYFINTRLLLNDFRIKNGLFYIDKETEYDSLIINNKFPVLKFRSQIDSLNTDNYKKHLIKKKSGEPYTNLYYRETEKKMRWVNSFKKNYFIKTDNQNRIILSKIRN